MIEWAAFVVAALVLAACFSAAWVTSKESPSRAERRTSFRDRTVHLYLTARDGESAARSAFEAFDNAEFPKNLFVHVTVLTSAHVSSVRNVVEQGFKRRGKDHDLDKIEETNLQVYVSGPRITSTLGLLANMAAQVADDGHSVHVFLGDAGNTTLVPSWDTVVPERPSTLVNVNNEPGFLCWDALGKSHPRKMQGLQEPLQVVPSVGAHAKAFSGPEIVRGAMADLAGKFPAGYQDDAALTVATFSVPWTCCPKVWAFFSSAETNDQEARLKGLGSGLGKLGLLGIRPSSKDEEILCKWGSGEKYREMLAQVS